jgi:hypothetical protein
MKDRSNYDVGYRKPPEHGKFQRGKSGNPLGRPKKQPPHGLDALLINELLSPVTVRTNGKSKTLTKLEVAVKRLVAKAMDGDPRTLKYLLDMPFVRTIARPVIFPTLNSEAQKMVDNMREQVREFLAAEERKTRRGQLSDD